MNTSLGVLLCNFYLLGKKTTTKDYGVKVTKLDGKRNILTYPNLTLLFLRQESRYSEVFLWDPLRAKGNHTPSSLLGHRIKVWSIDQWQEQHMGFFLDTEPKSAFIFGCRVKYKTYPQDLTCGSVSGVFLNRAHLPHCHPQQV